MISLVSFIILCTLYSRLINTFGQVSSTCHKIYCILYLTVLQIDIPQAKSVSKVRARQRVDKSDSTNATPLSYDL
jgi:hypothetical protein